MPEVSGDLITRNYSNFRGVDFSNTEVALYRSPDAINMWKDYKKMGTSIETRPDIVLFKELKNTVYGLFFYTINQVDHMIIHCGVSLYDYNMKTKELKIIKEKGMNIRKSQSFIYRNILYIKDGLNYLQYDGETCKEVIGYIPVTRRGSDPAGKGSTAQETNLLTGVRENSFCADGESTEYVLDESELDAGYQEKVFINNVEKAEGFTVDKVSGKVKFTTAPEKPLSDEQDNVVIRFSKTIPGNRDKINKCTILEVFDNRVFFSGNQDYPNMVFHTMLDEPKYCSDLDYYNEGADISPVRSMVAGNNALWVIKEPSQANTAIFYHNPTIDSESGKVYPSEHSSISTGCIGAAINFNDDIVYFSNRGMEGISGDITTEQVISHRSSLVDSKLLQEENYKDMILVEYEGYLLVIIKDKIYLADSRAMFTNENHNEYEWFYWNIDIEPTCAVVYNGELWLGSKQGIFKIGKASESNKEISMEKDEEERYFIDGVTKQETGTESYKTVTGKEITIKDGENSKGLEIKLKGSTTQSTRSGKNIFNKNAIIRSNSITKNALDTGVRITQSIAGQYMYGGIKLGGSELLGKTLRISVNWTKSADNAPYIAVYFGNSSSMVLYSLGGIGVSGQIKQITIPNAFSTVGEQVCDTVYILLYSNRDGTGNVGDYVDYTDLIVTIDNEDMSYEDYGVSPSPDYPSEIENVEGKNKFDINQEKEIFGIMLYKYSYYLKPNTKYTISSNCPASTTANIYANSNSSNSAVYINKNQTIQSDENGYFYILVRFKAYASDNSTFNLYEKVLNGTYYIQLEEGTVATPYVPYNSLEIKDVGENLLNVTLTSGTYSDGVTITVNKDKSITISGTNTSTKTIFYRIAHNLVVPAGDYTLSNNNANASAYGFIFYDDGNNFPRTNISNATFTKDTTIKPYIRIDAGITINNQTIYPMILKGTYTEETMPAYKPYQEQKVTFPLAEGQKLMEGSYLASDGIHNKRKQVVYNGTENWAFSPNKVCTFIKTLPSISKTGICTHYKSIKTASVFGIDTGIYLETSNSAIISDPRFSTIDEFKTYLQEQYSNGTPVIVEYKLAEEEIVPYTEEQQEAWDKIENMKLYDGINYIESTAELDIKYNYIYKKPSIKNKSSIENEITAGEYQTIINNRRYFIFLQEELKAVRNSVKDKLYIDTSKNIASIIKRVDKLVLNGTEEWNAHATNSNVFYIAKPKNMADNETNIFCTITDEFSKDLSGENYGILIDTNINIKIPKVKTVADLKAYLAKEPITIQYKATEEIKDIILLSKPSSYWTTCEDEFKYPQMQKTTNKRGCVADVIGEEIDVFCKTNKEQFEKIATHKNSTGYAVNRIKKKKWKSIQLKFSSNKSFELFSCTLESYIGSYIKR